MFCKAYITLLHTPNYVGEMQLTICITDESKTNSRVTLSLAKGETTCMLLLVTILFCAYC